MLGFYEAEDDVDAAHLVLQQATDWLAAKGCRRVVGPIDGDTWHRYRFNLGPYDPPAFLSEPVNPDYYPRQWASDGWEVVDSFHSLRIDDVRMVLPHTQDSVARAEHLGYRFETLDPRRFESELVRIYQLSKVVFAGNPMYQDISQSDFIQLYRAAEPLIDPQLVWFALGADGDDVGFLFCLVDHAQAIAAMKGQHLIWAKLKFLMSKRKASAVNYKSIGIVPEHRRSSLATALMHKAYLRAVERKLFQANLCLIRDGNPSAKLDGGHSRLLRRYALYGKSLER